MYLSLVCNIHVKHRCRLTTFTSPVETVVAGHSRPVRWTGILGSTHSSDQLLLKCRLAG